MFPEYSHSESSLYTAEIVKDELIKLKHGLRLLRTFIHHPKQTYFDPSNGFPDSQGDLTQVEAFEKLTVGEVFLGLNTWVESQDALEETLTPMEKTDLLHMLGEGRSVLEAYLDVKDGDLWSKAISRISTKQDYKYDGFPKSTDVEKVTSKLQNGL